MNRFMQSTTRQISRHGVDIKYVTVTEGQYDVNTGTVANTETQKTIKAFPKKVKATQYTYPNLIGRELIEFLIAGDSLTFGPSGQDKIIYSGSTFTVDSYSEHTALGEVCLYKVLAIKS